MSTSLAEQLQRLALPQTSVLKHSKKRASLLFDPKEAAGIKRDTFFQIGLEGLEELIQKNAIFEQFTENLFDITSKEFERSIQTAEANKKLDKTVRKFLLMLSPYFLLNCTHKALEWLINRFLIHEYNRDDVLKLILPYHESNIFVRMLQLLKFKDNNDSFYFLKKLQKPGIHLTKQTLLNHAASNSGFLKFVSEYILQLLKVHEQPILLTVAFNFYCAVFTGAIEYSKNINEDQVSQMLPALLNGLNSTISDFCAGSYVITARLLTKTSLSDRLLDKFVEKIADLKVPGLKIESVLVLIVLYQSQEQYNNVPQAAVASLSEREWLPKILQNLDKSGSFIYPFLLKLLKRCIEEGVNNDSKLARDFIRNCLDEIKIDDEFVPQIFHSMLDVLRPKMKYSKEVLDWLPELVQIFEKQYPTIFDKLIYDILSTSSFSDKKSNRKKKCLSKILKNTSTYKGKFDVFENLYHANPTLRKTALKFLRKNFDNLQETDREIIKSSLLDRLNDDNVNVVAETLNVIEKVKFVDVCNLKQTLLGIIHKCLKDRKEWAEITERVLNLVMSISGNGNWDVFLAIFPFLLPDNVGELNMSKKIVKNDFFTKNELLKGDHEQLNCDDPADFVQALLKILENNQKIDILKELLTVTKSNLYENYLSLLIISISMPQDSSTDFANLIFESYNFEDKNPKFMGKSTITGYIEAAIMGKYPVYAYLDCIIKIIQKIAIHSKEKDFADDKFMVQVAECLLKGNDASKPYMEQFLNKFFETSLGKVGFLLQLALKQNRSEFTTKILNYIIEMLDNIPEEELKQFVYIENLTSVFLLILLLDECRENRILVMNLFEKFVQISTRKSSSYIVLLEHLFNHKEEIVIDNEQVPVLVSNNIDPAYTKNKKHGKHLNDIRNNLIKIINESSAYIKAGILQLMSQVKIEELLEKAADISMMLLENKTDISGFEAKIVKSTADMIEAKPLSKLTLDSFTWKFIFYAIKNDKITLIFDQIKYFLSPLVLTNLDKEIFAVLNEEILKKLLNLIIEIASSTQNLEIQPVANKIFKHIDLNADWIVEQLKQMKDVKSSKLDPKRKRISTIPTVDILDTIEWKKGVYVLEVIQNKKKIKNFHNLLQLLFELLKKCLDFDEQTIVEYPKQLLLSSIQNCCERSEVTLQESLFNIELVVQCIRASQNPQTHHHALLVLAHTAHLVPSQVLHHMIAIFTFMGSSVLRHDDAYSFQIISKIIDIVIPILIKDNDLEQISKVLRVFVDVIMDVPEHRKLPLYKQLIEKVDVKENLQLFLLLVLELQVTKKDSGQQRLDFATNLCMIFEPDVIILTTIKLMNHFYSLPDECDEASTQNSVTFNISSHTPKEFRHYKYLILKFTNNLLRYPEFINKVAALTKDEELQLEPLFKEMIIITLQYIQRISKVAEKNVDTHQSQYWKTILHLSHDILDSINAVVTAQMFLLVTKGLMVHNLNNIKKRIMELFNAKLQYNPTFFDDCDKSEMFALMQPLVNIIEGLENESSLTLEQETVIQTALLSLKLLVKYLAKDNPEKIVPVLEFVTGLIKIGKVQNNILASLLLCVAEMCLNLKAYAISTLPDFMPSVLKILKQQRSIDSPTVLLRSVVTTVEKIMESLPLFLNPYLEKMLFEVSILIEKWKTAEAKLQPFLTKINSIKHKIGNILPLRVLLPAIQNCYDSLAEKQYYSAIGALMSILAENIQNLTGADVISNLPELTGFFLKSLRFRTDFDCDAIEDVENKIVTTVTVLVLKLSESSFRPLYYKLYDWAVRNEEKTERIITFYALSSAIAESLKGLFVLFAGHIMNNAANILELCNNTKNEKLYFEDDTKNVLLLENVLRTLNKVFLYDMQKFTNKDRFDVIMQPLVDQLENTLGGAEVTSKRNREVLVPCLVHFALALGDDALWKPFNYQILLKTRNNSPDIRLVTLNSLTEIVKKLGEDFLPLLPETIPFLAELLEDEEEEIEKACQKAVQEMEKVLGEPLRKYF